MKAAVLEALRKPLQVREVPDPRCPPNGVIVKTLVEGICRCDWHFWSGDLAWMGITLPLPHVLGHEFCGVIEEVGQGRHELPERRPRAGALQPGGWHLRVLSHRPFQPV